MKFNLRELKSNTKFLNIFCYAFCGLYFLFVLLFAAAEVHAENQAERELQNLLNYVAVVNKKVESENFFNSNNNNSNIVSTEPIFKDGKTAIITAYNNTIYADSFYAEANGTMSMVTMGIELKVATYTKVVKYNNTKIYEERANKLRESSASGFILNIIEDLANTGSKNLKVNEKLKYYDAKNVYFENNIPKANFDGSTIKSDDKRPLYGESLYKINEETILSVPYFKINYKKGVPVNYFVQVELDPVKSCDTYGKTLGISAGAVGTPSFSKIIVGAVIDAQGNLTGLTTSDTCTITKDTPLGVKACPCVMTQTYAISGVNQEMTFEYEGF